MCEMCVMNVCVIVIMKINGNYYLIIVIVIANANSYVANE